MSWSNWPPRLHWYRSQPITQSEPKQQGHWFGRHWCSHDLLYSDRFTDPLDNGWQIHLALTTCLLFKSSSLPVWGSSRGQCLLIFAVESPLSFPLFSDSPLGLDLLRGWVTRHCLKWLRSYWQIFIKDIASISSHVPLQCFSEFASVEKKKQFSDKSVKWI